LAQAAKAQRGQLGEGEEPHGQVGTLMRLMEELEEHDDVQGVHAKVDVDAEVWSEWPPPDRFGAAACLSGRQPLRFGGFAQTHVWNSCDNA
jgi:hypothetical protein